MSIQCILRVCAISSICQTEANKPIHLRLNKGAWEFHLKQNKKEKIKLGLFNVLTKTTRNKEAGHRRVPDTRRRLKVHWPLSGSSF